MRAMPLENTSVHYYYNPLYLPRPHCTCHPQARGFIRLVATRRLIRRLRIGVRLRPHRGSHHRYCHDHLTAATSSADDHNVTPVIGALDGPSRSLPAQTCQSEGCVRRAAATSCAGAAPLSCSPSPPRPTATCLPEGQSLPSSNDIAVQSLLSLVAMITTTFSEYQAYSTHRPPHLAPRDPL